MNISLFDKLKYYIKNKYDIFINTYYPYKKVIIDDWLNIDNKNDLCIMNSIISGEIIDEQFTRKKKVTLFFSGNRIFYTILYVNNYHEINHCVNNINFNSKLYQKKIKNNFFEFLNNIYLVTYDDIIINVTNMINNCIEYDNNIIIFSDISYLCNEIPQNIKNIKIEYTQNMKKHEKIIDFLQIKNKNIDILNNISNLNILS
jgi:hypothetical protein